VTRIAIIGPGAVGATIAAWLQHTGRHEIFLCARRPLSGLTVETTAGIIAAQPPTLTDPAAAPAVDWVLVTTKAYDAASAATWFPRLGATGGPVAILQNGVEHRERFAAFLPAGRIVPVVVDVPAERNGQNQIRQRGPGLLTVADDARGQDFAGLFAGTDIRVVLTPDFQSAAWRKLCLNSAGAISALLLQPAGILRDEVLGEVARDLVRECIAVGRAEGAVLEDGLVETVLRNYRNAPPDAINSLHADRLAGRPMEVDARNGAIVGLGKKHGVPTPCNRMAVALLTALSRPAAP
jgi:2-dehydropantoate 2-reductase